MGSTKNVLAKKVLEDSGDISGDYTSPAIRCQFLDNMGIQLIWDGDPEGSFSVQTSADHVEDAQGNIEVPGNWVDLPLSTTITASGSPDQAFVAINQIPSPWLRVFYDSTAGAGNLVVVVTGKGI